MKISTSESRSVRVGVLALFSQNALFNENGRGKKTGGAEKRSILLAEMLKELGYSVEIVLATPPWYCRKLPQVKGFSLHYHKRYRRNGQMIVRKVYSSSLWNRIVDKIRVSIGRRPRDIEAVNRRLYFDDFERVRADVWLALSVNDTALHLAEYCFKTNRSFILGLAHDLDLDFMVNPSGRDVYGASRLAKRIALSRAHSIFVQNKFQQEQVLQAFPFKPVYFLRNPIKIPELESSNPRLGTGVLWVGKFHSNKNPIGLVRIAKLLPGISFTMICNAGQRDVEEEIKSSLPMNVKLIEFVPPNKMGEWYQNATLHVSTSFQEGFPNTFLEAASYELPTFSLHVDPDGLMKQGILGACFYGDEQALATTILELFNHPAKGKLQGETARRYVLEHHAYPKIKEELRLTMNKIKVQLSKPKEKKIEG